MEHYLELSLSFEAVGRRQPSAPAAHWGRSQPDAWLFVAGSLAPGRMLRVAFAAYQGSGTERPLTVGGSNPLD